MVKILVVGAHGFVGYPVTQALVRAGHRVYGLTRDTEIAKELQENEIIPIIGDALRPRDWIYKVKDVDVVVDAAGGPDSSKFCVPLYQAFSQEARSSRSQGPPLTYIYTSSAWIHGDEQNNLINDRTPLGQGTPLTSWRIPHERQVTATKSAFIQGIVIRPGLVYGRRSSILGENLFKRCREGFVQWYGRPGGKVATVHQDDLADLFVKVVEKAPILGGLSFLGANNESESWDTILAELCKILNARDIAYLPASTPQQAAFVLTQKVTSSLARDLLGWMPKKLTLSHGFSDYYAAWQASQGKLEIL